MIAAELGAALLVGLVGSVHCLGMCGGIAGALGQGLPPGPAYATGLRASLYSVGRIASYVLAGAGVGALGHAFAAATGLGLGLRLAAGLLMIAIGLHVGGWWNAMALLERAGLGVWRRMAPLLRRIGRPDRPWKILAIGMLWGWLPCGLVYSALVAASTRGTAAAGALFMLGFGIGTLPALLFASGLGGALHSLARGRSVRSGAAILLMLFGTWTLYGTAGAFHGHGHSQHAAEAGPAAPSTHGSPAPAR